MNKLQIFCVTDKPIKNLENLDLNLAGVTDNKFSEKYIICKNGENINHKEKNYSELTFHYWFWKNELQKIPNDLWIGFCQKRRFWLQSGSRDMIKDYNDLKEKLLNEVPEAWKGYNAVVCKPISLKHPKFMKLLKRGKSNIIRNPSILFSKKNCSIKLHFDMHHGYGILDQAVQLMNEKDRNDFNYFVSNQNTFNPHIMFIAQKKIVNDWFTDLFGWLFECEKKFGIKNLKGYDQERLYGYLAERYLPFWFKKYAKAIDWDWAFFDSEKH